MSTTSTVEVRTASAAYTVEIGSSLLSTLAGRMGRGGNGALTSGKLRTFVVSSPDIWQHWGPALSQSFPTPPTLLTIPPGEHHKRFSTLESLAEQMAEAGADRDSLLIALGGGVIGDLTGFLAAIYMRGIRYVGVPTTLLAQVDSSLGGKTGANLAAGKNLIGSFHHPLAVYADIDTLRTLPPAELRAGLQESIKAGIIRDRALFEFLEAHREAVLAADPAALTEVITASVRVKAGVVSADERESGLRMLLNLGHTLGHAIEAATEYKQLLHGEAVAWGMLAAIAIADARGLITSADARRMEDLIRAYGPLRPFVAAPPTLVALTAKDKKNRNGTRSYVLPTSIGTAIVVRDVTEAELLRAAEAIVEAAAAERTA